MENLLPKDARVLKDSKTAPEGVVTKKIPYILGKWERDLFHKNGQTNFIDTCVPPPQIFTYSPSILFQILDSSWKCSAWKDIGFVELSFQPLPLSDWDKCCWFGKEGLGVLFVSLREARIPNISLSLCLEFCKKFLLMVVGWGVGNWRHPQNFYGSAPLLLLEYHACFPKNVYFFEVQKF